MCFTDGTVEGSFTTDTATAFDLYMSVCVCAVGIISAGDEDEAKGPVEKAHGEV